MFDVLSCLDRHRLLPQRGLAHKSLARAAQARVAKLEARVALLSLASPAYRAALPKIRTPRVLDRPILFTGRLIDPIGNEGHCMVDAGARAVDDAAVMPLSGPALIDTLIGAVLEQTEYVGLIVVGQACAAVDVCCDFGIYLCAIGDEAAAGDVRVGVIGEWRVLNTSDATIALNPPHAVVVATATVNHLLLRQLGQCISRVEPCPLDVGHTRKRLTSAASALRRRLCHSTLRYPIDLTALPISQPCWYAVNPACAARVVVSPV
eukprot:CAMPEP_0119337562 /NCGR_PEP_ID=MMETSP1333-20130426/94240_1 /TAXON_ID=418940 /ORGANISM="Scyphosphaera apsteinii, Strain RCC1455" /LENGTH=263 /DNA_ID=CAMNT_0007348627 /DNA_START=120 /DNA_END=911 /DNA_ORIENTATION=-